MEMDARMMSMSNNLDSRWLAMPSARVSVLTREDITVAAKNFRWSRQMPKWTVFVGGREFPARPLVLEAAGALPNDPTNSHQAVAILESLGFDVRYEGKTTSQEASNQDSQPISEEYISSLRGCCKGEDSLVEALTNERRNER